MNNGTYKLIEGFKNPTNETSPVMMWFWNSDIDKEGITYQMERFLEQGITDFFIHPSGGMRVVYLSDEYMELIKYVVSEAKRLGMKYWIYDENDWPSGVAGGLLLEEYPEYVQEILYCHKGKCDCFDMRYVFNEKGTFLGAQRIVKKKGQYFAEDITDRCIVISENGCNNIQYQAESLVHEELYFYFSQKLDKPIWASLSRKDSKGMLGYVNMMKKEPIAKFIEMTHERYKAAIGEEFGKTVMGVFTDEPTTIYQFVGPHPGPWDDDLFEVFEKEHGYSLKPYMYALFYEPLSAEDKKARADYRATVKRLYYHNFVKQIADWCRENNLLFTGHYGGEEHLRGMVDQGDMLVNAMEMDIPGLDCIYSKYCINDNEFNIAGKLISSAAKFKGANRILCETYTCSGHDYRICDMKRVGNRLVCMGANMIQYMGASYSRYAVRRDNVTTYNYTSPVFRHFGVYNKYLARLQYLSRETVPESKVLVFNPLRQIEQKMDFLPHRHYHHTAQNVYEDTVNGLLYAGIGFDLFSEDLTDNITVKDGYIEAYGYRYECVVFPDMYYVNSGTAKLIKNLVKKGVKTLFIHELPTEIVDTKERVKLSLDLTSQRGYEMQVENDNNCWLIGSVWPETDIPCAATFREIIGKGSLGMMADGRVYISERSSESSKVYFIANDEKRNVKTRVDAVAGMKIYNATTGEETAYPVEDGRVEIELLPYELVVVICDKESEEIYNPEIVSRVLTDTIVLDGKFDFEAVKGNMLPIAYETFDKQTEKWEKADLYEFPANMQFKPGEYYKLRGEAEFEYVPDKVYVNVENDKIRYFRINGTDVELTINTKNYSEFDCKIDVTQLIKKGTNTIEFEPRTEPNFVNQKPPMVFFSGNFAVTDGKITAPATQIGAGGWEKQGYPYYSGCGIYKTTAFIDKDFVSAEIEMDCEDVSEITINGNYVGKIMWHPLTLDITEYLNKGTNNIEIAVTSTSGNTFKVPVSNGIQKSVKIKFYN